MKTAPDTHTTNHTPGPWFVFDDEVVADRTDRHICVVELEDGLNPAEWQANLRLIASAPELLTACKELVVAVSAALRVVADLDALHLIGADSDTRQQRLIDELHVSGVVDGFGVRANAIIAKAEGRSGLQSSAASTESPSRSTGS